MTYFSWLQNDASLLEVFESDERFQGVVSAFDAWMRGPSELTIAEREVVASYVAMLNECSFCVVAHKDLAKAYGLDPAIMNEVLSDECADNCRRLRAVLDLARTVTISPSTMSRDEIDKIVDTGLSERTAQEVVTIAALFGMMTRLADAHGVKVGDRQLKDVLSKVGPKGGAAEAA